MWLFRRKSPGTSKEAEIRAIKKDIDRTVDNTVKELEKLNKELEKRGDTAYLIFYATGGGKRSGKS